MLPLREYVRYPDIREFPSNLFPLLTDHLLTVSSWLEEASERPLGLVALYPVRPTDKLPKSMQFFTFSKKKTAYSALRQVENVLAEFYLRTDVLPFVSTVPSSYLRLPHELPPRVISQFKRGGALLYGVEE